MEEKIDQILRNQATILTLLGCLYAGDKGDDEMLKSIKERITEMMELNDENEVDSK